MALHSRVARTIREHALARRGDRIAVALSGGADSVALVWLLADVAADLGVDLAGVIHVNHQLRGADADADEAFCRSLADRLRLPIEVGRFDVAALANEHGQSLEVAARETRYAFFAEAAGRLRATSVATGHTLDDQAETVLLRLLRGATTRGAAGIRVRRGLYIRPLLDCRRADLRRHLAERGEPVREDATNADLAIARNRVRHQLLPAIEDMAPGGLRALARFAALAADDEAFLEAAAEEAGREVRTVGAGTISLDVERWLSLPPPLARRLLRHALEQVAPAAPPAARHLDDVLALARSDKPGGHLDLPGAGVDRIGPALIIKRKTDGVADAPIQASGHPLPVPGRVEIPEAGVAIVASVGSGVPDADLRHGGPDVAIVQATSMTPPLVVRGRLAGDRLRPLGAPGRRKVQDVLVDHKVPRARRDHVPIVVDAAGRIVWIAGLVMAHECRVTSPQAGVVILELRKTRTV